ncbi:MAG: hypothetical protein JXQ29_05050 [Planctomycetes bacterium]|nr:hypothetical protein [Planctomycetota bacterium]
MSHRTLWLLGLAAAALLAVPACVELTGQRISWFHDVEKDELVFVIHYDGIHDRARKGWLEKRQLNDKDGSTEGAEQIPAFVESGSVMIGDWPFHLDRTRIAGNTTSDDPLQREAARLVMAWRSEPLGHYREPAGRIGGVQRVTLPGVTAFLRDVNALLSRALVEVEGKAFDDEARQQAPRTIERVLAAAKQGWQWIALDGHAIRVSFPVHPGEWAALRARVVDDMIRDVMKSGKSGKYDDDSENSREIGYFVQALASAPISYLDEGERVTFVLGRRDRPVTWRIRLREEYEPSLEPVVIEHVKTDLDRELAAALLDEKLEAAALRSTILRFGPPEEPVRAMIGLAERGADAERKAAAGYLKAWAEQWNRETGVPAAPVAGEDAPLDLAAWKGWYQRMKQFPAPE